MERWVESRHRALGLCTLALVTALGACSDAVEGKSSAAPAAIDPRTLLLETDLDAQDARAGLEFVVKCRTFAPPPAGSPAGTWGPEVPLPGAATVVVTAGPAGALAIDSTRLRFWKTGAYALACQVAAHGLADATPAELTVVPGFPTHIDTVLQPPAGSPPGTPASPVAAGTPVGVTCTAADSYGNAFDAGFALALDPPVAPPPVGLGFTPTKAGTYAVACVVDAIADATPATLQVVPAVPKHLFTLLDPPQIPAGYASKVGCVANDMYGNAIADFPFSLDLAPAVSLKGLYVTTTQAGLHDVRCVPESLDWNLFVLHAAKLSVVPGPPHALEVAPVPAKQVYKREEKVQFISTVRDAFSNLIPGVEVVLSVTTPAKGYKVKSKDTIQFNLDASYTVHAQVGTAPEVGKDIVILVDGAPPLLTIDEPPWGSTLTGKPSVHLKGTVGDQGGSGVTSLKVNGKQPQISAGDTAGMSLWVGQHGAQHGLNRIIAEVEDLGGQKASATRGFYFSGKYYPTDAAKPKDALVGDGVQLFLGKDFLDDGVHDPAHPDDLATLVEVMLAGLDPNALVPGQVSQGDMEVKLSNISFGKPKVSLVPVAGGLQMQIAIPNIKTDLAVKAKQKIGPIKVTLKVSGDIQIANVTVQTHVAMSVVDGQAKVSIVSSNVDIDGMKLHVDGLAGLLDFLWTMLLGTFTGQLESQLVQTLNDQIPSLVQGLLTALTLDQTLEVPALLPGAKATSLTVLTVLKTFEFSPAGGIIKMDAGFVAPKGTSHTVLGSIGRAGCIGTATDAFAIDQTQRLQFAAHDDFVNQALYAIWYGGALAAKGITAEELGLTADPSKTGGFSLEGAVFGFDLFLPPILESCNQTAPAFRLQVGDANATIALMEGDLVLGLFASLDVGAQVTLGQSAAGAPQLAVQIDKKIEHMIEIVDISKDFADAKPVFQGIFEKQLQDALAKGVPGLDALALDLPSLDLGALVPGLPLGAKIALKLKDLKRAGGYTAMSATLE